MSKHTPGPWFAHPAAGYQHAMGGYVSNDSDRLGAPAICDIRGCDGQPYQANARLIAAAPELLEALKELLAEAESEIATCPLTRQQARAAIAKATQP